MKVIFKEKCDDLTKYHFKKITYFERLKEILETTKYPIEYCVHNDGIYVHIVDGYILYEISAKSNLLKFSKGSDVTKTLEFLKSKEVSGD